jgi:Protein of unknown function (DUF2975)
MSNSKFVFKAISIVAWFLFIGLCLEAGALLVNFVFSLFKPEIVKNLYQKLDLSQLYYRSKWIYFSMYIFVLLISFLKAYLFYVVIVLIDKIDLSKPFSSFVSKQILRISYVTFFIGILSFIASEVNKNLLRHDYEVSGLNQFWIDSQAFVLMSAIVYIIGTIFKKGVEIQNENDLTV